MRSPRILIIIIILFFLRPADKNSLFGTTPPAPQEGKITHTFAREQKKYNVSFTLSLPCKVQNKSIQQSNKIINHITRKNNNNLKEPLLLCCCCCQSQITRITKHFRVKIDAKLNARRLNCWHIKNCSNGLIKSKPHNIICLSPQPTPSHSRIQAKHLN